MAQVTLVIVDESGVFALTAHWRQVKSLLANPLKAKSFSESPGYVLLDLTKSLVINAQQEFRLEKIGGFEVLNL